MKARGFFASFLIVVSAAAAGGCAPGGGGGDDTATGDADSDADSDVDADADADADADTDADGDGDADTGTGDGPSTDCPHAGDPGPAQYTVSLNFGGLDRSYTVHAPPGYDPSEPAPLVVNMHGLNTTAAMQISFSQMNEASDAAGYLVIYPQGVGNSWNAGGCCGQAEQDGIDDVGFLRAVVQDARGKVCVDAHRVYATGMSNGGHMAWRLACEAADVFAAVAPVAGAKWISPCNPSAPVPVIAFHGTEDPIVFYALGESSVDSWVPMMGCDATPSTQQFGGSHCDTWTGCDDGISVVFCTMDPMGHCWPGGSEIGCTVLGGPYNDDIDANAAIWAFFGQYSLP